MQRGGAEVQIGQQLLEPCAVFGAPLWGSHPGVGRLGLALLDLALQFRKHKLVVVELHHAPLKRGIEEFTDGAQVFADVVDLLQHAGDEGKVRVVVAREVIDRDIA